MNTVPEIELSASNLFDVHKQALFNALKAAGITWVEVDFEGSGDSGAIENVEYTWLDTVADETTRELAMGLQLEWYTSQGSRYDASRNTWVRDWALIKTPLSDAVEDFAYSVLGREFGGWMDNDGSYGTVSLDVLAGKVELSMNQRYTSRDLYERTY